MSFPTCYTAQSACGALGLYLFTSSNPLLAPIFVTGKHLYRHSIKKLVGNRNVLTQIFLQFAASSAFTYCVANRMSIPVTIKGSLLLPIKVPLAIAGGYIVAALSVVVVSATIDLFNKMMHSESPQKPSPRLKSREKKVLLEHLNFLVRQRAFILNGLFYVCVICTKRGPANTAQ